MTDLIPVPYIGTYIGILYIYWYIEKITNITMSPTPCSLKSRLVKMSHLANTRKHSINTSPTSDWECRSLWPFGVHFSVCFNLLICHWLLSFITVHFQQCLCLHWIRSFWHCCCDLFCCNAQI